MKRPLLSVVIPTYNRYEYLRLSIESIIEIDSDEFEIIIQDNTSENDEILSYLESIGDNRIKYFHISEHISVMENCDMAIKNSIGKFVCMIGDDDTICENMIKAALFCDRNGFDTCCYNFPGYNWQDMIFEGKKTEANLFFKTQADGKIVKINSRNELLGSVKNGGELRSTMPRLYHGLVGRDVLERIYNKISTYFPGPSPDMANAVPVCLEAKNTVYINDYLIVSGYGKNSARGEGNRREHFGDLSEKPWLPKDILDRWIPRLPAMFSAETIIAQSMLEALTRMSAEDYLKSFNYGDLYATFFAHNKKLRSQFIWYLVKHPQMIPTFILGIFKRIKKRRKYRKYSDLNKSIKNVDSINSLLEAQKYTQEVSKNLKYHYKEAIDNDRE